MTRLNEVRAALAPHIHRTPLWHSRHLSELLGRETWIKAELFQRTGSYKPRGMLWAMMQLSPEARARGTVTFSAGNAAQGLAYAGGVLGISTTVVMSASANPTKVAATKGYGARVIQHGTPQEAAQFCLDLAASEGLTYISSYDDDELMTGHASLGAEIFEDLPAVADIILGIGGGGMAGGMAKAAIAQGHKVRLWGAEPEGAAAMSQSLETGKAVRLPVVSTIADGLAAPSAGELCYALVRERFEGVHLVSDAQILEAMKVLMARLKIMPEPAACAGLAVALARPGDLNGSGPLVLVISGGNLDLASLKGWL
ncbi:threonine ammonia-lyase [Pseudaminobacter soli (ex Li et al. 2025)]|uniref:threonine ammonia-lyase n=1 Tax=Pseudaminobacter soli (ex Li et al. 2025) TaxID=1295366 RepID=UPI0024730414|nr:threonine/serine dehydratase [Mesorhizobium soli]